MKGLSIVIPAYNESEGIVTSLIALKAECIAQKLEYEIIVVDDGSEDDTAARAEGVEGVRVIRHRRNRGYGRSLKTGIIAASNEHILTTDADNTYPVEALRVLCEAMETHDMAVGARTGEDVQQSYLKRFGKWPINRLADYLVGFRIPDLNSGMRIFKKETAERFFGILPDGFSFSTNITLALLSEGYSVAYIPINYHARMGKSKVRPGHAVDFLLLVTRMILLYNPLKFFFPISFLFGILGVVSVAYDVSVLGGLSDKTIIFIFAALNTLSIGLLADLINKRSALSRGPYDRKHS